MKNFALCILSFIGLSTSSIGQITISSWCPTPWQTNLIHEAEIIGEISAGNAGANQTWDFSSLGIQSSSYQSFVPVSELSESDDFPFATVAEISIDALGTSFFYSCDNIAYSILGQAYTVFGNTTVNTYDNRSDVYRFPIEFGQSFTDISSYTSISTDGSTGDVVDISFSTDTSEVIVDGSGTLVTPVGSFNNVLRIKTTGTDNLNVTSYDFISEDYPGVVLLNYFAFSFSLGSDTIISFADPSFVGIEVNEVEAFSVYPNPANAQVTISATSSFERVEVLDLFGRVVSSETIQSANNNLVLNTSGFASGVYLVRAFSAKGKSNVNRLVISH